jgi:capsid protein
MESWKTLMRRRSEFSMNFATPIYAVWLQEAMENGELPLPKGAPDYVEAATSYARCNWLGPARGWIDPVKERQGAILGMDAGISTLQRECSEQGTDWEENIDQRAIEVRAFKDKGLPPPNWYGNDATNAEKPQDEPVAQ